MVRKFFFDLFFLLLYLLFIFYITLYTRSFSLTQSCNPDLFWSYAAWAQGKPGYGREILLNIDEWEKFVRSKILCCIIMCRPLFMKRKGLAL